MPKDIKALNVSPNTTIFSPSSLKPSLNTHSVAKPASPIRPCNMHVSKLFIVSAILLGADAFRCAVGQHGSCTFVEKDGTQHRCAIKCGYKGGYTQCNCPQYYQRNDKKWPYGGKHACLSQAQYVGRFKC